MKIFPAVVLLISFLLPITSVVFANNDFCQKIESVACDDDLTSFSENPEIKNCSQDSISKFHKIVSECKSDLEKEKEETGEKLGDIKSQENSAEKSLENINWSIKKLNTEVADLNLSISQIENEIKEKERIIGEFEKALEKQKEFLTETVRQIYEYDATSTIEILLGYGTLSDFGDKLEEISRLQINLRAAMEDIRNAKNETESGKADLERKKEEDIQYRTAQEMSRQSLTMRQDQQKYLLGKLAVAKTPLEKEMARIETDLIELKKAMPKIQNYLGGWLIGGQPTWSQIFATIQNVSNISGVRPALLLAILQMESKFKPGAGYNAGSPEGNLNRCLDYRKDDSLCYQQKPVFEEICLELDLNYNSVPISATYAMGPSQIIPTTWRGYQRKYPGVRNPWSLNDAVLLMGYILRDNGAVSGNERGAVYAYNHSWGYVDDVLYTADYGWQEVLDVCGGFDLSCPEMKERLESKLFKGIPTE